MSKNHVKSSMMWMASGLLNLPAGAAERRQHNPRPPGSIQPNGTSGLVLRLLEAHAGQYLTCAQIIRQTGRSHSAVSFALMYLRSLELIHGCGDSRNSRYFQYSAARRKGG